MYKTHQFFVCRLFSSLGPNFSLIILTNIFRISLVTGRVISRYTHKKISLMHFLVFLYLRFAGCVNLAFFKAHFCKFFVRIVFLDCLDKFINKKLVKMFKNKVIIFSQKVTKICKSNKAFNKSLNTNCN